MIKYYFSFLLVFALFFQPLLQSDIADYIPKNIEEMQSGFEDVKKLAIEKIEELLLIHPNERTFENTALAYDRAFADFQIFASKISLLNYVHPDPDIRLLAETILLDLASFSIDHFESHKRIYEAISVLPKENLNDERQYYLDKLTSSFKKSGILLSSDDFESMKHLQNKIAALSLEFNSHINQDESVMRLTEEEVVLLAPQTFPKEGDHYLVPCNANTVSIIVKESHSALLRQYCYQVYRNRCFPKNWNILKDLIETRHKLALLLGYNNFAEMDLSDQMAKTPSEVHAFIDSIGNSQKEKNPK